MDPRLRQQLYDRIHAARREEEAREAAIRAAEEEAEAANAENEYDKVSGTPPEAETGVLDTGALPAAALVAGEDMITEKISTEVGDRPTSETLIDLERQVTEKANITPEVVGGNRRTEPETLRDLERSIQAPGVGGGLATETLLGSERRVLEKLVSLPVETPVSSTQPGAHAVEGIGEETEPLEDASENESLAEGSFAMEAFAAHVVDEEEDVEVATVATMATDLAASQHELELIEGVAFEHRSQSANRPRGSFILAVFGVLVCTAVVVMLVLVLSEPKGGSSFTSDTKHGPSKQVILPPFQEGLDSKLLDGIQEIGNPYYLANKWSLDDPHLESYGPEIRHQRFMMTAFYYFTAGNNWTRNEGWLSYQIPECNWYSSHTNETTCDEHGFVDTFNLSSNNLYGEFSKATYGLKTVRVFDVSNNELFGPPPGMLTGSSARLEEIIISNNKFTGRTVYQNAGEHLALGIRVVKSDGNQLFGTGSPYWTLAVPALEVFNNSANSNPQPLNRLGLLVLKNLTHYSTRNNDRRGTIPSEYGKITSLQELDIANNPRIEGSIPSELGLLTSLTSLDILGTSITGTVPDALCERVVVGSLDVVADCNRIQCCREGQKNNR